MENKVIITSQPNFIDNIECILKLKKGQQELKQNRFSLNEFDKFINEISHQDWLPMKVNQNSKMQYMPNVRSSKINPNIYTIFKSKHENIKIKTFEIENGYCNIIDNDLLKFNIFLFTNNDNNIIAI